MKELRRPRRQLTALVAMALVVPGALAADGGATSRHTSVRMRLPSQGNVTLAKVTLKVRATRRHRFPRIRLKITRRSKPASSVAVLARSRKLKRRSRRLARYAVYVVVLNRRPGASPARAAALGTSPVVLTTNRPDLTSATIRSATDVLPNRVRLCFDGRDPPGNPAAAPQWLAGGPRLSGAASAKLLNTAFQQSCPNMKLRPGQTDGPELNSFLGNQGQSGQPQGGNQPPAIQRFTAVFGTQCSTCTLYTVDAYDPDGKIADYSWSKSPPPGGAPGATNCGQFFANQPTPNQAYWDHPNTGPTPCSHAASDHPGYITVVVTDDKGGQTLFTDKYGSADYSYP